MPAIHENLKQLRLTNDITQEQAARQLHLTRQAVSSHESGRTQPSVELLQSYAKLYGVELEDIIYGNSRRQKKRKRVKLAATVTAVVFLVLELLKALLLCISHTTLGLQAGGISSEMEPLAQAHFKVLNAGYICGNLALKLFPPCCLILLIMTLMLEHPISRKRKLIYFGILVGGSMVVTLPFLLIDPVAGYGDYFFEPILCLFTGALFLAVSLIADLIRRKRRKTK